MPAPRPVVAVLVAVLLTALSAACSSEPDPAAAPPPASSSAFSAGPLPGAGPMVSAPSSPTPTPAPTATPATVVVDPGHNGGNGGDTSAIDRPVPDGRGGTKPCNTTGTSTSDGYPEHAFTWAVSQRLADELRARGVRVVLTRDSDDGVGPCVDERGEAGARARADAVVSVHADGGPASGHGFHVLYSSPPLRSSQGEPSRSLATSTVDALRGAGFDPADYIGRGGVDPRDDIAGLNLASVPSVLVECANLRNARDAAVARSPQGQARYARGVADAVVSWLATRR